MVVLSGKTGPVVINAKVAGYREVALYAIGYYEDDAKVRSPRYFVNILLGLSKSDAVISQCLMGPCEDVLI